MDTRPPEFEPGLSPTGHRGTILETVGSTKALLNLSPEGRFMTITAQTRELANKASRSRDAFQFILRKLNEINDEVHQLLHTPDPKIVMEMHATRPGRKKIRRSQSHA